MPQEVVHIPRLLASGVSGDVNSSLARGSYSDKAALAAASTAASAPAAEQKVKRPSLRQRLQVNLDQTCNSKSAENKKCMT